MVINIEENIVGESSMERENTPGPIHQCLRAISRKECDMDMEHGNPPKSILIFMLAHMRTTKKADTADTFGQMDAFMKGTSLKM